MIIGTFQGFKKKIRIIRFKTVWFGELHDSSSYQSLQRVCVFACILDYELQCLNWNNIREGMQKSNKNVDLQDLNVLKTLWITYTLSLISRPHLKNKHLFIYIIKYNQICTQIIITTYNIQIYLYLKYYTIINFYRVNV